MPLAQNITLRLIKVFDIGWAAAAYFGMALCVLRLFSAIFGTFDANRAKDQSTAYIVFVIILQVWMIGVSTYIARNLFILVPFPLHGVWGYNHYIVREIATATVFTYTMMTFDANLQARFAYLKVRLAGKR